MLFSVWWGNILFGIGFLDGIVCGSDQAYL